MAVLWYLFILGMTLVGGLALLRRHRRIQRDRDLQTYSMVLPSDLQFDQVKNWFNSISGTLQHHGYSPDVAPTIVFEAIGDGNGIRHRLRVPLNKVDPVMGALRALIPGVNAELIDDPLPSDWTEVWEVGIRGSDKPLHIPNPEALATSVISSLQHLGHEMLVIQWVVTTGRIIKVVSARQVLFGDEEPDGDKAQQKKEAETHFQVILRIACKTGSYGRAQHLLAMARDKYRSTQGRDIEFYLMKKGQAAGERVTAGSVPSRFAGWLSVSELAAVIGWPIGAPHIAGLPRTRARQLPVPASVPREGAVLGRSNYPGAEREVGFASIERCKHLHICGPTGVGKTTLLANMAAQDMAGGSGVIVIASSKGDLFYSALDYVPMHRVRDVVVLDVLDEDHPVGYNVLQGRPQNVASDMQALFDNITSNERGMLAPQALYHGIMTLMTSAAATQQMTFVDLIPLFLPVTPEEVVFSQTLSAAVQDSYIRQWWDDINSKSKAERQRFFEPLRNRMWQLNNRPEIRRIIGQSQSSFSVPDLIRQNKILLVNLKGIGQDSARLMGSLMLNSIWNAVQGGAANPASPTYIYLDEFQDYLNLAVSPADMFAQARSYGLAMTVAHQHVSQLNRREVLDGVMANARSKIVFRAQSADAFAFKREFGKSVTEDDFMGLMAHEAIAQIATVDGISQPFTMKTLPPFKPVGQSANVVQWSRHQFARPVDDVDAEIAARRSLGGGSQGQRAPVGPRPWNP